APAPVVPIPVLFPDEPPVPAGGSQPPAEPPTKGKDAGGADKKKAEDEAKKTTVFVVGDDLKLNATWDAGGLRLKTADEAFSVHLGGRLMSDAVWWTQSRGLRLPAAQPAGSPLGTL